MNLDFLCKLSEADSIASNEEEVRNIMVTELKEYADEVTTDNMGSVIFKQGKNGPKIMLCAHMDEVGFMVRSISPLGHIRVMVVGGVKPLAQLMQEVRITTNSGKKIVGVLQGTYKENHVEDLYVDLGVDSAQDVYDMGIQIGDMITYTTNFKKLEFKDCVMGKAFDDRLGCYVIGEVLKRLSNVEHSNIVYAVGTSSEEVGIRGAKTATYKVNPDIVLPIDVACFSNEFVRDYTNKRQIGKGMMQTNFDRTLAPNRKLIQMVRDISKDLNKDLQLDMFNSGGTDGGEAHKSRSGVPTAVNCLPVRYGHCAYSIARIQDLEDAIEILVEFIKQFDQAKYNEVVDFLGGI